VSAPAQNTCIGDNAAVAVEAGWGTTFVSLSNGSVLALEWGKNGRLGHGGHSSTQVPRRVSFPREAEEHPLNGCSLRGVWGCLRTDPVLPTRPPRIDSKHC